MKTKRLKYLAKKILTVPEHKLKLDIWQEPEFSTDPLCNTAACAIGWACTFKKFQKKGLHSDPTAFQRPVYKNTTGWNAAEKFFGINHSQSEYLFLWGGDEKPTPKGVSQRIKQFIKEQQKLQESLSKC